jgi:hypothetical protein
LAGQLLLFLYLVLSFLSPLGLYCLALAYVNRSRRPVLVPGGWDFVALLFGLSGFVLLMAPVLLIRCIATLLDVVGREDLVVDYRVWAVPLWVAYLAMVAVAGFLILRARQRKTSIYNVDTERFADCLGQALAELGLDCIIDFGRLVIAPADAFTAVDTEAITTAPLRVVGETAKRLAVPAGGPRYAELTVDSAPTLCHITLHWDRCPLSLRREIEQRLGQTLQIATAADNPIAGWLLGFSGLLLGTVIMISAFILYIFWARS